MSAAETAYEAAERAIAKALREERKTLDFSGEKFHALTHLPPEIAHLTALESLDLDQTAVADIAPLAHLTALQTLGLNQTAVADIAPLARLTALRVLSLANTPVADLRPLAGLKKLGTNFPPGLAFRGTPATQADAELARLAEIDDTKTRARETLAYLDTLPPWPQPYTPKSRPDGKPPEPIGDPPAPEPVERGEPPAIRTADAQIRGLMRNALVTRVSAAGFAAQISEALRGVPATHGNELAPPLQMMLELRDVLELIAQDHAEAKNAENLLRLRISQLEALMDRLTRELSDAQKAKDTAEALAKKDGFMAAYRKSLGTAAGVGTVALIGVGVPTAAIYFLGADHPLVQAFLTAVGKLPKP